MAEDQEVAVIPLVEEQLEVTKREVETARVGVRILVDGREETGPGLLIGEELVIGKSGEERVERVSGSVCRTGIEVEDLASPPARQGSAFAVRGAEPYEPPA